MEAVCSTSFEHFNAKFFFRCVFISKYHIEKERISMRFLLLQKFLILVHKYWYCEQVLFHNDCIKEPGIFKIYKNKTIYKYNNYFFIYVCEIKILKIFRK